MGVRLYNATTGRFLSVDSVDGGSANDYDYANQDPANTLDLDGRSPCDCDPAMYQQVPINNNFKSTMWDTRNRIGRYPSHIQWLVGPFPQKCKTPSTSRSSNCYAGRSYGYKIIYGVANHVWKYGITSVPDPRTRANQSRRECERDARTGGNCEIEVILIFTTRIAARTWEWVSCANYTMRRGHRPIGMTAGCR
jgi:hypothetical protein